MNFQDFLSSELSRRKTANPRYSLRAFAKNLKTDPSSLSQILKGKRKISARAIRKFGLSLGMPPAEIEAWQKWHGEAPSPNELKVEEDHYRLIADWYHYALFELFAIPGFRPVPREISRRLGISADEAKSALERLERLGAIERRADDDYVRPRTYLTTHHQRFSTPALRTSQHQALDMAKASLENVPYERREQIGLTIAARASDLETIRKKMRKFHKSLNNWIERRGGADTVYVLTSALNPVSIESKPERRKTEK